MKRGETFVNCYWVTRRVTRNGVPCALCLASRKGEGRLSVGFARVAELPSIRPTGRGATLSGGGRARAPCSSLTCGGALPRVRRAIWAFGLVGPKATALALVRLSAYARDCAVPCARTSALDSPTGDGGGTSGGGGRWRCTSDLVVGLINLGADQAPIRPRQRAAAANWASAWCSKSASSSRKLGESGALR